MPITLPPDYFGSVDPGFSALVQGFSPAFSEIHDDAARDSDALSSAAAGDVGVDLGNLDGDADVIANDTANEHTAVTTAATGDVLAHYATADGLTDTADRSKSGDNPPPGGYPAFGDPPRQDPGLGDGVVSLSDGPARRIDVTPAPEGGATSTSPSPAPAASPAVSGGAAVGAPQASAPVLFGTSEATAAAPDTTSFVAPSPSTAPGDQHVTHAQLQDILSQLEATIVVMV